MHVETRVKKRLKVVMPDTGRQDLGELTTKMTLYLYKRVINSSGDHMCSCDMVGKNGDCLSKTSTGPPAKSCMTACVMITGPMRTTPTKVLQMLSDLPQLVTVTEAATLAAAHHLPRPN